MKKLSILLLLISFSLFSKPMDFKYLPSDANVYGYVSNKKLMKNSFIKKTLKDKEIAEAMATLKKNGVDFTKIGFMSFFGDGDSLANNPKQLDKAKFALITKGVNLEKVIKARAIKEGAKTKKHKGFTIYVDKDRKEKKGEATSVTFIESNTVIGSLPGVKSVINTYKKATVNAHAKSVNKMIKKLKNPEIFAVNLVSKQQRQMMNQEVKKNQANPMMTMLAVPAMAKSVDSLGVAVNLRGNKLKLTFFATAKKSDVTTFVTALNGLVKQYLPMLKQQVGMYQGMLGKAGTKEVHAILKSLKVKADGRFALISIEVNLNNVKKALKTMEKKQQRQNKQLEEAIRKGR